MPPDFLGFDPLWTTYTSSLVWFSMTAAILYDHLSTLDLEVELIWKKKWSLVKLLYLANRYVPDAGFLYGAAQTTWVSNERFTKLCHWYLRIQTWFSVIPMIAMQAILVHRIICMYSQSRIVLFGLVVGYGTIFITGMVLAGLNMQAIGIPILLSPTLRVCVPRNIPSAGMANWFLMLVFDLAMFALAFTEGIRHLRRTRSISILQSPGILTGPSLSKRGPMVRVLFRDSIVFPFIGLLICIFNIVGSYVLPQAMPYMLIITSAACPFLGCRLILHLRDAYYRPFKDEFDQSKHSELQIEMPAFASQSTTFERDASRTTSGTSS